MSLYKVIFQFAGGDLYWQGADQFFEVPPSVKTIFIKAWGAGGGFNGGGWDDGDMYGGPGGYSSGYLHVTPGQLLTIIVGGCGYPLFGEGSTTYGGGGAGGIDVTGHPTEGASGGGRSAVRLSDGTEVLTAGGGGGCSGPGLVFSRGGSGGGILGTSASISSSGYQLAPGQGGSQISGGVGGTNLSNLASGNGSNGDQFQGGSGGSTYGSRYLKQPSGGGGGGGGYFGGGGGAAQVTFDRIEYSAASGGGGSGYIGGVINGITQSAPQGFYPPNTDDFDYIYGVGTGGSYISPFATLGGPGLVVIYYGVPDFLTLDMFVDKTYSDTNSDLTYTIAINNISPTTVTNVVFVDTIPSDTTLVPNSLTLDNTSIPGTPHPPGITIPSIGIDSTSTVQFKLHIGSTIPSPNPIVNTSTAYSNDGSSFNSNAVYTMVNNANLSNLLLNVDNSYITCGDEITFLLTIPNTGNTTALNVILFNTIPNGAYFVEDSLYINGVNQIGNPVDGINIGVIPPSFTSTVSYKFRIYC